MFQCTVEIDGDQFRSLLYFYNIIPMEEHNFKLNTCVICGPVGDG